MNEVLVDKEHNYVHLISGGLDSTYSLLKLAKDVKKEKKPKYPIHPIFFDYGQFAANTEWKSVLSVVKYISSHLDMSNTIANPVQISLRSDLFKWCKNVAFTGEEVGDKTCEIQNRNMILISVLASYLFACAENQKVNHTSFEVHSGFKNGEMPDCNRGFFDSLAGILLTYRKKYKIKFEIMDNTDRQGIINRTKKLLRGSEEELKRVLRMTISCYSPINGKPCGSCWKCNKLKKDKIYSARYAL